MKTNVDCSACSELKDHASEFMTNGVTKTVCTSLKNDTGFNPNLSTLFDDCEDLDLANDCLVGMMEKEVDYYDVCDWKEFMKNFIPNLHQLLKAGICALCGIWTKLHKHECLINHLYDGFTFSIGEESTDNSYVVAGKGVSFLSRTGTEAFSADISMQYIGGALGVLSGSLVFHSADFTDAGECVNFDNGSVERTSQSRLGNSVWATVDTDTAEGNELIYEIRLKNSAWPEIDRFFYGVGQAVDSGHIQTTMAIFTAGKYAYGQHGHCDDSGNPTQSGYSSGHLVPDGWTYIQLRMSFVGQCIKSGATSARISPRCFFGMRFNRGKIDC